LGLVSRKLQNVPEGVKANSHLPMFGMLCNCMYLPEGTDNFRRNPFTWAQAVMNQMSRRKPWFDKLSASLKLEAEDEAVLAAGLILCLPTLLIRKGRVQFPEESSQKRAFSSIQSMISDTPPDLAEATEK
jgi:hypothetical protein